MKLFSRSGSTLHLFAGLIARTKLCRSTKGKSCDPKERHHDLENSGAVSLLGIGGQQLSGSTSRVRKRHPTDAYRVPESICFQRLQRREGGRLQAVCFELWRPWRKVLFFGRMRGRGRLPLWRWVNQSAITRANRELIAGQDSGCNGSSFGSNSTSGWLLPKNILCLSPGKLGTHSASQSSSS